MSKWNMLFSFDNGTSNKRVSQSAYILRRNLLSVEAFRLPKDFWGSVEEYEVHYVIKKIINSPENAHLTPIIQNLSDFLESCSLGWITRLLMNFGMEVLHKLLLDLYRFQKLSDSQLQREYALVSCLYTVYSKSDASVEDISGMPNDKILKLILRSLISLNENTRLKAAGVVKLLQQPAYRPSKVLCTINMHSS